jgi:hypothetical protein
VTGPIQGFIDQAQVQVFITDQVHRNVLAEVSGPGLAAGQQVDVPSHPL